MSLIAWLFCSWTPRLIPSGQAGNKKGRSAFNSGSCWEKWFRKPCIMQKWEYVYSMRLDYMQRLFDQAAWNSYNLLQHAESEKARVFLLNPRAPFQKGKFARKVYEANDSPNYNYH